jgi:diadenosine tetraphosphate (Ap4A) HIT family hydrolase
MAFALDERLHNDTIKLTSWPLCEVLLMNDAQFPWLILVPRIENASELFHLNESQRLQLDQESIFLSTSLMSLFSGDKLNVAALGNVVKQLHIHHVVRFEGDIAWPAPVWGKQAPQAYSPEAIDALIKKLGCLSDKDWSASSATC